MLRIVLNRDHMYQIARDKRAMSYAFLLDIKRELLALLARIKILF